VATQFYTASSIDGFIADRDHSLDWLLTRNIDEDGPMNYGAFIAQVGALAMGANTYRWLLAHPEAVGEAWPYEQPTWVFFHGGLEAVSGDIRFTSAPIAEVHAEMAAAAGGKNLWVVGGGGLAGQFAEAGLLDEVWVQYAPIALGVGAPLLPRRLELRLEEAARNRDFVCARYTVVR
jgi:dihydrofolate reductase